MIDLSKSEKRELRLLGDEAYKAELAKELNKVEAAFTSWREGTMSVFELDDCIHEYYSGPRKKLYNFYQLQNQPESKVARAVAVGLISRDRITGAVLEKIQHLIQFFKEHC
jgi:hypothetical protein